MFYWKKNFSVESILSKLPAWQRNTDNSSGPKLMLPCCFPHNLPVGSSNWFPRWWLMIDFFVLCPSWEWVSVKLGPEWQCGRVGECTADDQNSRASKVVIFMCNQVLNFLVPKVKSALWSVIYKRKLSIFLNLSPTDASLNIFFWYSPFSCLRELTLVQIVSWRWL